jgi:hypothetical protein
MLNAHVFFNSKDKVGKKIIKKTCLSVFHMLLKKHVHLTCHMQRETCHIIYRLSLTQFGEKFCPLLSHFDDACQFTLNFFFP